MFEQRRADPTQGVFETLLVLDGEPIELEAHLERLHRSLDELYGQDLPRGLADRIRERSRDTASGKARITASSSGVEVELFHLPGDFCTVSAQKSPTAAISLHSLTLSGGLGPHKWADRSLLNEAQADMSADELPLIVDRDGAVLEASRANVFAVRDGALLTPPLDGRILPGITRTRVIGLAAATGLQPQETELSHEDLLSADEVFLSGSVRGIERVHALDGAALAQGGGVADRIAAELRRAWTSAEFG